MPLSRNTIAGILATVLLGAVAVWSYPLLTPHTVESGAHWSDAAAAVPVDGSDAVWGKRTAPVTIVVFSEVACPYSAQLDPTLESIRTVYGRDKVRVVWKNYPQQFHTFAQSAAIAGETIRALAGLDAFLEFRRQAFQQQTSLTPENVARLAARVGVRPDAFKTAMDQDRYRGVVEKDVALARSLGVSSTPAVFINGIAMPGAQVFERYAEVIEAQLKKAGELLATGVPPTRLYVELTRANRANVPAASATPSTRKQSADDLTTWKVALGDSPVRGNATAPVTMVVFGDFQCPHSRRATDIFRQLMDSYGEKLRIVWKDRPLAWHPQAMLASIFAREARKQKGDAAFWRAHDKLFANNTRLEPADLLGYAAELGLDAAKVKVALASDDHADAMQKDIDQGDALRANATPHVFINGRRVLGVPGLDEYKTLIDEQLAKADALMKSGVAPGRVYDHIMNGATEPPPAPPPEKRVVDAPGGDNPWRGGANAKVVIQVFGDFQCTHSKRALETLSLVGQRYGDKVKIVWRHRPLPIHPGAALASEAAQEVFAQQGNDGFWKYHRLLFENQLGPGGLDQASLERLAAQVGADVVRLKAALESHSRKPVIDADKKAAESARILSTPTFMINGYYVAGAVQFQDFRKLVVRALHESD